MKPFKTIQRHQCKAIMYVKYAASFNWMFRISTVSLSVQIGHCLCVFYTNSEYFNINCDVLLQTAIL